MEAMMGWVKSRVAKHEENIEHLSIDATGRLLLCVAERGQAYLWNVEERSIVASIHKRLGLLGSVALSPEGRYAVLYDGNLWLWDCRSPVEINQIDYGYASSAMCFIPDTSVLAIGGLRDIRLFDIRQNREVGSIHTNCHTQSIACSPNGRWMASASDLNSTIHIWDLEHLNKYDSFDGHRSGNKVVSFIGQQDRLVTHDKDGVLVYWDLKQARHIRSKPTDYQRLAVNKDGDLLAGSREFGVTVFDTEGNIAGRFAESGYVWDIIFSPTSNTLYTAVGKGVVNQLVYEPPRDDLKRRLAKAEDWLCPVIESFQEMGFFASNAPIPAAELSKTLRRMYAEEFDEPLEQDPQSERVLVHVLSLDKMRVWWRDTECVYDDAIYTRTLSEWASISRGSFQPQRIREEWDLGNRTVSVSFESQGKMHSLQPNVAGDWLDLEILDSINRIISETGYLFTVFTYPGDQTACVVCLTEMEKHRLGVDWGITFEI